MPEQPICVLWWKGVIILVASIILILQDPSGTSGSIQHTGGGTYDRTVNKSSSPKKTTICPVSKILRMSS